MVVDVATQRHHVVSENSSTRIAHDGGDVLGFAGNLGLLAQRLQLAANFARKVGESCEVRLHRVELADRLFFAATVFEDSGRFLDETAAVFGGRLQNGVESTLTDDDVHLATESRVRQKFLHIEKSARFTVNRVLALATAEQRARDGDLGVFDRQCAVRVVDGEDYFGSTERPARRGTSEDDVFHLSATKSFSSLLTHDPGECVDDVRLPRTVRTDDGGHAGLKVEGGRLSERLEALESQGLQVHGFYYRG